VRVHGYWRCKTSRALRRISAIVTVHPSILYGKISTHWLHWQYSTVTNNCSKGNARLSQQQVKKGAYSSSWNSPQNYGTPLVKWDHTVLPDRGGRPAFTPTGQVGTRFIDPVRMKGWVGLVTLGYLSNSWACCFLTATVTLQLRDNISLNRMRPTPVQTSWQNVAPPFVGATTN